MPQYKHIKRLVRARMFETGERYTAAKAAIDTRDSNDAIYKEWIEELGDRKSRGASYRRLTTLPDEVLLPLAVTGTSHGNPDVRRGCCRLLDNLAFTPESHAALERCASDGYGHVRRAAYHSLLCQHCKPDGCVVDTRGVVERMASDGDARVRKMAATSASWSNREWAEPLVRQLASRDQSAKVRAAAQWSVNFYEWACTTDEARRQLPDHLVAKTERHPGKRVAISDGQIVGVNLNNRAARHYADLKVYWVAPD